MSEGPQRTRSKGGEKSRLVNDPTDRIEVTRVFQPQYPRHPYRRNKYHLNNHPNYNRRVWTKFNSHGEMGGIFSTTGEFMGYRSHGKRNQNEEWVPPNQDEIQSVRRKTYEEFVSDQLCPSSGRKVVMSEEIDQRGLPSNDTEFPFPISVSISTDKNAEKNKAGSRRRSNNYKGSMDKEERVGKSRRSGRNDHRVGNNDRDGSGNRRERFSRKDKRNSMANNSKEDEYDAVSESSTEDEEDLRHKLKRHRNSRREPGEISDDDDEEPKGNDAEDPVQGSSSFNARKRRVRVHSPSISVSPVEIPRAAKKVRSNETVVISDSGAGLDPPATAQVVPGRPFTAGSTDVVVEDGERQSIFSDDNLDNISASATDGGHSQSITHSQESQEPASGIVSDTHHSPDSNNGEKLRSVALEQYIAHLKDQVEDKTQKEKEQRKEIEELKDLNRRLQGKDDQCKELTRQLRAKEEQFDSKIKALRSKTVQLEKELADSKRDRSVAEQSLKTIQLKLTTAERNLEVAEEKVQRLQSEKEKNDADKNHEKDTQIIMAMAYQDRLMVEVEKLKSVYEVELLKMQDYYQSTRMQNYVYPFQPVNVSSIGVSAVGAPLVHHNVHIPIQQGGSPFANVNCGNPTINTQRNSDNLAQRPRTPNNQPRPNLFGHLGSPDPIPLPVRVATRVPMFLHPNRPIASTPSSTPIPRVVPVPIGVRPQNPNGGQVPNTTPSSSPRSNAGQGIR